ncbi:MAG TPA: hypothetical protein VIS48_01730 [Candidatus Kryptonia bacterium]
MSVVIRITGVIILVAALADKADAQLDFLRKIFEPQVFQVSEKLRDYIRTELPPPTHDRLQELKNVDLIFVKAMEFSKKQIPTCLLAASIAVLNRTDIKPTFPLLGMIRLPLPAEDSSDAAARIRNLPRYIFSDSPQDSFGDSDKLVHFFGSAYLSYATGTNQVPDAIGKWIEDGEVAFKLDTKVDPRDVFANELGQQFGVAISQGRDVLPSDFLNATYIKR